MMHVRRWKIVRPAPPPRIAIVGCATLLEGDCAEVLATIADNSVDSIVTDPPYALVSIVKRFGDSNCEPAKGNEAFIRSSAGFMGKRWDTGDTAHSATFWRECLRVLKPGGYLLAMGGTRTYHRLACAIEDAGFDIRDMVQWLYGSGFPKSHDVSKGIDRAAGAEREVLGYSRAHGKNALGLMNDDAWQAHDGPMPITMAATAAAREWAGWGTALKPANEPICMARKPLSEGTVAANVLRWGTGAINVDGCRVEHVTVENGNLALNPQLRTSINGGNGGKVFPTEKDRRVVTPHAQGRFPANVVTDGSDEVVAAFPPTTSKGHFPKNTGGIGTDSGIYDGAPGRPQQERWTDDAGSAARFFYAAKANAKDRAGSKHPTVKPISLMRYLCRLVTPPGGTVLDPFAGTGTTGEACHLEGFKVIMVEREADYIADIRRRMAGLNIELQ